MNKTAMQVTIFVLFVIMNLVVLVLSLMLFLGAERKSKLPEPPTSVQVSVTAEASQGATPDMQARQVETLRQKVVLYNQAVQAYERHVAAYGKLVEESSKMCESGCGWNLLKVYELVVKDSLVPLITALITGLVGAVFVGVGGELLKIYLLRKRGETGDPVSEPRR